MTIFRSFAPAARSAAPATCTIPPTPRGTDPATAPPARRFNKLRRFVSGLRRLGVIVISFRTVVSRRQRLPLPHAPDGPAGVVRMLRDSQNRELRATMPPDRIGDALQLPRRHPQ